MYRIAPWLILAALSLVSCIAESTSSSSQGELMRAMGYPDSLVVHRQKIAGIVPARARAGIDSTPLVRSLLPDLGANTWVRRDLFLEYIWSDSASVFTLRGGDSLLTRLRLQVDSSFYANAPYKDSLPLVDSTELVVRWRLTAGGSDSLTSLLQSRVDTAAAADWRDWIRNPGDSAILPVNFQVRGTLDSLFLPMPPALGDSLRALSLRNPQSIRLEMWLAAPAAQRVVRFLGEGASQSLRPLLLTSNRVRFETERGERVQYRTLYLAPVRTAQAGWRVTGDCLDCVDLFGGLRESLLVELPTAALDSAWNRWVGSAELDGADTRWFLERAIARIAVTPGVAGSELGYPVPVLSYAVQQAVSQSGFERRLVAEIPPVDSAGVSELGHPHLLFHDRDTLEVDITLALRHYFNNRASGIVPGFSWRLGLPMLRPTDIRAYNYYDSDYSFVQVFSSRPAHGRYDFGDPSGLRMDIVLYAAGRSIVSEVP